MPRWHYIECQVSQQEENDLICEKLLGWKKVLPSVWPDPAIWSEQLTPNTGRGGMETPTFTAWAEAGLILEAVAKTDRTYTINLSSNASDGSCWEFVIFFRASEPVRAFAETGPLAIRAAALAYLKAQP
jgi:hypothetical protein